MLLCVQILLVFFSPNIVCRRFVSKMCMKISLWLIWKLLLSLIWKEFDDDVKASRIIKHFSFFQKSYKLFAVRSCCCRSSSSFSLAGTSCSAHILPSSVRKKARSLLGLSLVSFAWGHKNFFSHFLSLRSAWHLPPGSHTHIENQKAQHCQPAAANVIEAKNARH